MVSRNPKQEYNIEQYHQLLCRNKPDFLEKYLHLPIMERLKGIGLLCGTDWTSLYKNRIYYSRYDHSVGVALIIWNFTHNKAQTLAGLFHDVSTPVFSHVSDFRKGDALTQTVTEAPNAEIIRNCKELLHLLEMDGLTVEQVEDYHKYPIADNEIPQLSADRLEYMFPSGMALDGSWTMEEICRCYEDIEVLTNEQGEPELGFKTTEIAEEYCEHFCMIGHILQLNENKLTLHMLGQIMNEAVSAGLLQEEDFMNLCEREILEKLEKSFDNSRGFENIKIKSLERLYKTFRTMTEIAHTEEPLPDHFCVSLKVKERFINPLVKTDKKAVRITQISSKAAGLIADFHTYSDSLYGCVKLI